MKNAILHILVTVENEVVCIVSRTDMVSGKQKGMRERGEERKEGGKELASEEGGEGRGGEGEGREGAT